jgi:hypothetical protein
VEWERMAVASRDGRLVLADQVVKQRRKRIVLRLFEIHSIETSAKERRAAIERDQRRADANEGLDTWADKHRRNRTVAKGVTHSLPTDTLSHTLQIGPLGLDAAGPGTDGRAVNYVPASLSATVSQLSAAGVMDGADDDGKSAGESRPSADRERVIDQRPEAGSRGGTPREPSHTAASASRARRSASHSARPYRSRAAVFPMAMMPQAADVVSELGGSGVLGLLHGKLRSVVDTDDSSATVLAAKLLAGVGTDPRLATRPFSAPRAPFPNAEPAPPAAVAVEVRPRSVISILAKHRSRKPRQPLSTPNKAGASASFATRSGVARAQADPALLRLPHQ